MEPFQIGLLAGLIISSFMVTYYVIKYFQIRAKLAVMCLKNMQRFPKTCGFLLHRILTKKEMMILEIQSIEYLKDELKLLDDMIENGIDESGELLEMRDKIKETLDKYKE